MATQPSLQRHMETSKKIVLFTGLYAALQIQETMFFTIFYPDSASTLLTICLSCITGYITILSWYFGKALGENKLKITQSIGAYHSAVSGIASGTVVDVTETEEESSEG